MPTGQRTQSAKGDAIHQQAAKSTATATSTAYWNWERPRQLQDSVPPCASSCLSSYINQDFECSTGNLTCLCSEYSSEGYTLGELAYICLSLDCQNASEAQAFDAFNACSAERGAVQATHSTLTLPATRPASTSTSSATTFVPHTVSSLQVSTTSSPSASASSSVSPITSSVPSTSIHSPTATAASAATTPSKGSTSLTTAEAVGISIACMGAIMIAIGLAYLIACLKRRKTVQQKEERHSYDFVDDAPPRLSPFNHGDADQRGPPDGSAEPRAEQSEKHRTQRPGHHPHNSNYQHLQPLQYHYHEKDLERSPHIGRSISPESPRSDCSMRTTSQLLPDNPSSVHRRPGPQASAEGGSYTPETVFEEERSTRRVPGALLVGLPAHPAVLKSRQPQFTNKYTQSPEALRYPPLSLEIPPKSSGSGSVESLGAFPLPPPRAVRPHGDEQRGSDRSKSRSSNNSLLNYYASPDCASPEDLYSSTPIDDVSQIRRPPPTAITVTKPTYPPKAVRISTVSDTSRRTSFESTDPDEPTPPEEEDKQLSPVAELESPISGIRYPKVPRSSNQSVPRSPNYKGSPRIGTQSEEPSERVNFSRKEVGPVTPEQHRHPKHSPSPSLSGTTLAAKRRGDSAVQGLHITTSSSVTPYKERGNKSQRMESPLKGYGRVATGPRREAEWPLVNNRPEMGTQAEALKSPLWEPKLTPRKEGDDLYLSVSAATPKNARFHGV